MTELHTSHDAERFSESPDDGDLRDPESLRDLVRSGSLLLQEGKFFHQFDDRWGAAPRYVVRLNNLLDKRDVAEPARYYRAALRKIARSTDERTGITTVLPPGVVFADSTISEMTPWARPAAIALRHVGLVNSFVFDWLLRQRVGANVNIFLVRQVLVPELGSADCLLIHAALRLTCNHAGYEALWREQLGAEWREPAAPMTWPVLEGPTARGAVRAAIDAVVAHAYGLDRKQFEHVLASFSHKSDPQAPRRRLAAFDELLSIGPADFCKKHDPYFDLPLVTTLPQPVIDLPAAAMAGSDAAAHPMLFDVKASTRPRKETKP